MRVSINNWTKLQKLEVLYSEPHGEVPALTNIICSEGPLRLQFSMGIDETIAMALALMASAVQVCESQLAAAQPSMPGVEAVELDEETVQFLKKFGFNPNMKQPPAA